MVSPTQELTSEEREKRDTEILKDLLALFIEQELADQNLLEQAILRILIDYPETDFMVIGEIIEHAGISVHFPDLDSEITHVLYNLSEDGKVELSNTAVRDIRDQPNTASNS